VTPTDAALLAVLAPIVTIIAAVLGMAWKVGGTLRGFETRLVAQVSTLGSRLDVLAERLGHAAEDGGRTAAEVVGIRGDLASLRDRLSRLEERTRADARAARPD